MVLKREEIIKNSYMVQSQIIESQSKLETTKIKNIKKED